MKEGLSYPFCSTGAIFIFAPFFNAHNEPLQLVKKGLQPFLNVNHS